MKKLGFFLAIVLTMAGSVFAQSSSQTSFTVQSVTGRVQREAGNGRVDIVAGDVLAANTIIHTGIGANMVLRDGERTFTIPAAQNGRMVSDLIAASSSMRISGNVTTVDTGAESRRTTGHVATGSARASDAAADNDIADDDIAPE
ncbi:MAG: hypothetical protein LBC80_04570 [Treponema sp.]|jgi:hypothetical protein|nr:hypothetical protein [Treponema sp.]